MEISTAAQSAIDNLEKITGRYESPAAYARATYGNLPDIEIAVKLVSEIIEEYKIQKADFIVMKGDEYVPNPTLDEFVTVFEEKVNSSEYPASLNNQLKPYENMLRYSEVLIKAIKSFYHNRALAWRN
ncbi:MAG: hypothetical protein AB7G44_04390 [Bacteroidia bacterium]